MDVIRVQELEVFYHVGVPAEERANAQRLLLNVELHLDFSDAAAKDDLSQTIDYFDLTRRLLTFGKGREWKLIEKLAVDMAEFILSNYQPKAVRVEVQKFILAEARYVSVSVERP